MNSAQRFELQNIREDQDRLHRLVQDLDRRIELLGRNLIAASEPPRPKPTEITTALQPSQPPPLPTVETKPEPARVEPSETKQPLPPQPVRLLPPPSQPEPNEDEPLELRVGTFWMARIGIVILLTGLVFLGNYAYHRIIPLLGPWGKVTLLMLAGLGLGGAGYWMDKSKETLRNFGRVLLAGGAATVYYTTYAAHFVQSLRVIEDALLGGILLLAVAGGIAWYAERKRSETVATLAVLLSYYTSAINSIAGFTLFSSLLLTAVAVYFLVRNHWTNLSSLSLFATYGSYAFWRFHQFEQLGSTGGFGTGPAYLTGYWLLFTVAVFVAASTTLRPADRTALLTLNNAAFFGFVSHHYTVHLPGAFWMFAIGFGGLLLGLASLAAYRDPERPSVDGAYLAQGLIAITSGFAAKFSGPQLSMVLALESAALLACTRRRHGPLYEIGAALSALGAFALVLNQVQLGGNLPWSLGIPVAALLLFNAWWIKYLRGELYERLISERSLAFTTLGLILAGCVVWQVIPDSWIPTAFALLSLVGLAAFRIHLAEVGFGAQLFIPFAALLVYSQFLDSFWLSWWTPASVVIAAIALLHWWQSRREDGWNEASNAMQLVFAATAVGVGICWMRTLFHGDAWLLATSLTAIGTIAYGLLTRAWTVAIAGQVFSVLAIASFIIDILVGHPAWNAALSPVAAMAIISVLVSRGAASRWPAPPETMAISKVATSYRLLGAVLFAIWSFEYVPVSWRVAFFAAGGALQIVAGSFSRSPARLVSGSLYAIAGITMFWIRIDHPPLWSDLITLISIPFSLRISTHLVGEPPLPRDLRNTLVTLVLVSVWLWVTRWTLHRGALGELTTSWTILALVVFAAGLTLRERIYRLGGFAILGLALGRLFLFDVWKFDSLYRIVSFLVLGAALLALSFVYHRFSETFRKFL
jgi:uncharacterized membrane protein